MFFFKIISKSIWIGLKEDLCVVSVSPTVENTLTWYRSSWYPQNKY